MRHPLLDKHCATLDGAQPKILWRSRSDVGKHALEAVRGQRLELGQPSRCRVAQRRDDI